MTVQEALIEQRRTIQLLVNAELLARKRLSTIREQRAQRASAILRVVVPS